MKNPKLIAKPFAKNGQKNEIPDNYTPGLPSDRASWDTGFPDKTMIPKKVGGEAPRGLDFNGIFNQISENIVYLSQGGRFKFSAEYAEAIGGYPKGAILQSDDEKKEYLSLIDNNKVDFNTATDIGASWKLVNTDDLISQIASKQPKGDYATKTELNSGLAGKQPAGDYATKTEVGLKLDKNAVVQAVGTSTTEVMSQKAVTDLANTKQPTGTYADGKVFKALLGDGASIEELTKKYVFALKEDGTVALYNRELGGFLWAIEQGKLANKTGQDSGLIMSQKAVTDALNLFTPLSSFTSGAGWIRFPDGTIMQWGTSVAGFIGNPVDITFPIPFTVQAYTIVANYDQAKLGDNQCPAIGVQPMGDSWFRMVTSRPPEAGLQVLARWYALGR